MTEIVKWEIMTHLRETTSLHKLLFLEHCHQIRALFIYFYCYQKYVKHLRAETARMQKRGIFCLTESRLCT